MGARRFFVRHAAGEEHAVDYDTDHGLDVLRFQIFSLTSVPPHLQKIVVEADGSVVDDGADLGAISEWLRLVEIEDGEEGEDAAAPRQQEQSDEELARTLQIVVEDGSVVDDATDLDSISEQLRLVPIDEAEEGEDVAAARLQEQSDEELARMLQAVEEALLLQQFIHNNRGEEFKARVEPYVRYVLMYEDLACQEAARKTVPIDELEEKALVSLAKEGNFSPSRDEENHAFLLQLLFWFKQSFSWVNAPPCDSCGRETSNIGMANPLPSETEFCVSHVEIYRCNYCYSITRFPRYNDPSKLVQTRRGRCGEWANCFTLYCRAFGYEARLIQDFTDHVWTECFSNFYGRWMHLDPCEGVYDNPLLYEKGWNKKLNYVIAVSKDGVHDVSKRYTRKWHEVLSRRKITTEDTVSSVLSSITSELRSGLSVDALSALENRDKKESEELSKAAYLQVDAGLSLPGRQSGSMEWRKARSELGKSDSLSYSACPVRKCVDAHVSNIYDALFTLLVQSSHSNIPKARVAEALEMMKNLMLVLKAAKFKSRRASVDPKAHKIFEVFPCVEILLSAISLKAELGTNGVRSVTTYGNPIYASLALPVALDAVDEILSNYKNSNVCTREVHFPRVNRLSSGSVLGSGEQLPIGIATAAFDGIRSSKWEEPNGAKGCWLIYKMLDSQMCELESYDLMSANDVPERDPMDWILEGSADGGSTWDVIDERSSQMFESRFLRKTFTVAKICKANAFRFQFLRVRESNNNPRFQIGSIDLYGKSS